eukprot:CAMPEP_0119013778 /NCGR_PEP_ID=MMETSP1176-20130426/8936_1 /TAXON_ID=265551 /ORGANISM="Synedropsis recta cf, Strain CCMP1620" /LENGTH=226 /DNA_ID=CAMNT_0006966895 /DNA_START=90 /DNA_END=770 /DNA_ORIENTATION=+
MQRYELLILLIAAFTADAFMPSLAVPRPATVSTSALQMAGFGAAAPKKGKGTKKKDIKLKPKPQWDRYVGDDLKASDSVRVAVRVVESTAPTGADNDVCWFEVGAVKSKENAHTEAAVIRHRLLIADHARRMFPLKILANDKLEWGYSTAEQQEGDDEDAVVDWIVAGKVEDMPDDIDKLIGFQGLADPSGFYAFSKGLADTSTTASFNNMKNKGIVGHSPLEVHD